MIAEKILQIILIECCLEFIFKVVMRILRYKEGVYFEYSGKESFKGGNFYGWEKRTISLY